MNLTSAKAIRIIGVLRYNLQHCPQAIRSQAYATLLLPVLEYGPVLRDPSQQHPTLRRCSAPSSKVCHWRIFFKGCRRCVHHASSTRLVTTEIPRGSDPSDHVLQSLLSHCKSSSPSPATRQQKQNPWLHGKQKSAQEWTSTNTHTFQQLS